MAADQPAAPAVATCLFRPIHPEMAPRLVFSARSPAPEIFRPERSASVGQIKRQMVQKSERGPQVSRPISIRRSSLPGVEPAATTAVLVRPAAHRVSSDSSASVSSSIGASSDVGTVTSTLASSGSVASELFRLQLASLGSASQSPLQSPSTTATPLLSPHRDGPSSSSPQWPSAESRSISSGALPHFGSSDSLPPSPLSLSCPGRRIGSGALASRHSALSTSASSAVGASADNGSTASSALGDNFSPYQSDHEIMPDSGASSPSGSGVRSAGCGGQRSSAFSPVTSARSIGPGSRSGSAPATPPSSGLLPQLSVTLPSPSSGRLIGTTGSAAEATTTTTATTTATSEKDAVDLVQRHGHSTTSLADQITAVHRSSAGSSSTESCHVFIDSRSDSPSTSSGSLHPNSALPAQPAVALLSHAPPPQNAPPPSAQQHTNAVGSAASAFRSITGVFRRRRARSEAVSPTHPAIPGVVEFDPRQGGTRSPECGSVSASSSSSALATPTGSCTAAAGSLPLSSNGGHLTLNDLSFTTGSPTPTLIASLSSGALSSLAAAPEATSQQPAHPLSAPVSARHHPALSSSFSFASPSSTSCVSTTPPSSPELTRPQHRRGVSSSSMPLSSSTSALNSGSELPSAVHSPVSTPHRSSGAGVARLASHFGLPWKRHEQPSSTSSPSSSSSSSSPSNINLNINHGSSSGSSEAGRKSRTGRHSQSISQSPPPSSPSVSPTPTAASQLQSRSVPGQPPRTPSPKSISAAGRRSLRSTSSEAVSYTDLRPVSADPIPAKLSTKTEKLLFISGLTVEDLLRSGPARAPSSPTVHPKSSCATASSPTVLESTAPAQLSPAPSSMPVPVLRISRSRNEASPPGAPHHQHPSQRDDETPSPPPLASSLSQDDVCHDAVRRSPGPNDAQPPNPNLLTARGHAVFSPRSSEELADRPASWQAARAVPILRRCHSESDINREGSVTSFARQVKSAALLLRVNLLELMERQRELSQAASVARDFGLASATSSIAASEDDPELSLLVQQGASLLPACPSPPRCPAPHPLLMLLGRDSFDARSSPAAAAAALAPTEGAANRDSVRVAPRQVMKLRIGESEELLLSPSLEAVRGMILSPKTESTVRNVASWVSPRTAVPPGSGPQS